MVEINGARLHLTAKEYQMLELLSLRKGNTLTKEMFLTRPYGGMTCSSASYGKSCLLHRPARITSRRSGAGAMP
jgi:hypothetical protein